MKMHRWMSDNTFRGRIKNENMQGKLKGSTKRIQNERLVQDGLVMYEGGTEMQQ